VRRVFVSVAIVADFVLMCGVGGGLGARGGRGRRGTVGFEMCCRMRAAWVVMLFAVSYAGWWGAGEMVSRRGIVRIRIFRKRV